eukprot:CAMPEP_0184478588 /NCGR_PEP_ID=MMETSP0113_2-20130426/577_1 /TAXON_ID=91329 /ORGANISM="Norrisiella sphaerica, Strain BC52" /LENGTH=185 /DNA_ID=CAMNT_0026856437 /DNA_START=97 /DNA_END=654 /DNA_ORIENTATION=+
MATSQPSNPPGFFSGDRKYEGDGGMELERVWQQFQWREIRGCPGRYVVARRAAGALSSMSLVDLLARSEVAEASMILKVRKDGKDPMDIIFFPGGGGIITYCRFKKDGEASIAVPLYIHTLNTESGLIRKILDMGIEDQTVFRGYAAVSRRTRIIATLLSFLNPNSRSKLASTVTVTLHAVFSEN